MEIIKKQLKWRNGATAPTPILPKTKIDSIALHHMAHPTWTFDEVHAFHRDTRGWQGIAYGWWVDFKGNVYEGRGFAQNAGVKDQGSHIIDIGFQGNYEPGKVAYQGSMPDAQFNAGVELIQWLKPQLPNLRVIHGHKYFSPTTCPGQNFPLVEMVSLKKRGGTPVKDKLTQFDDVPAGHWAESAIASVAAQGIMIGKSDKLFAPNEPLTRAEMAVLLTRFDKYLKGVKKDG